MSTCTILTGSVTQAMKVKRLLAEHSIPAEVAKRSTGRERKGCTYGIEYACAHSANVARILHAAGIPFEEYRT